MSSAYDRRERAEKEEALAELEGERRKAKKPAWLTTTISGKEKEKINIRLLAEEVNKHFHFFTCKDNETVYVYDKQLYIPEGGAKVKEDLLKVLGNRYNPDIATKVTRTIEPLTYVGRDELNKPTHKLRLKNGILDLEAETMEKHTHKFLSTFRVPVVYSPKAKCPVIEKFFGEIVEPEMVPVLEELIGYCLWRDSTIYKATLLVGGGHNGKSTFISLLRTFLGAENVSSVDLQSLETDRFSSAELFGKLANLQADLPSITIRNTSRMKALTGGDLIEAQVKFKNPFRFVNTAKLIFSVNRPPKVADDSEAFWGRWMVIDFPNEFRGEKEDLHLLKKLTTPGELSGLLNLGLRGLKRLKEQGKFSYSKSIMQVRDRYQLLHNPVYAFVMGCCELDGEAWVPKLKLYQTYCDFATKNELGSIAKKQFGLALKDTLKDKIMSKTRRDGGDTTFGAWEGIKIREDSRSLDDF